MAELSKLFPEFTVGGKVGNLITKDLLTVVNNPHRQEDN